MSLTRRWGVGDSTLHRPSELKWDRFCNRFHQRHEITTGFFLSLHQAFDVGNIGGVQTAPQRIGQHFFRKAAVKIVPPRCRQNRHQFGERLKFFPGHKLTRKIHWFVGGWLASTWAEQ